jgi:hypothetical protein
METKAWYYSKVLWFNVLSASWAFIGPKFGLPELTPEVFSAFVIFGNIVLRFITKTDLTIS